MFRHTIGTLVGNPRETTMTRYKSRSHQSRDFKISPIYRKYIYISLIRMSIGYCSIPTHIFFKFTDLTSQIVFTWSISWSIRSHIFGCPSLNKYPFFTGPIFYQALSQIASLALNITILLSLNSTPTQKFNFKMCTFY